MELQQDLKENKTIIMIFLEIFWQDIFPGPFDFIMLNKWVQYQ
jgi:hypothetical protein